MFNFSPPENFLEGKTILITGASDGIGLACGKTFADYGATVILLGRSQEKLESAYDAIESIHPGKTIIHPMDFITASPEYYTTLCQSLNEQFSCLDGLIHNAGLLGARTPIEFYPDKEWMDLMQVNVNAAFYLSKALIPSLSRSQDARMIFTSSSVGRIGRAYWGAYAVSKFAVEGLMQTLADELRNTTSIKVNSLNPGGTRTSMRRDAYPAENPATQPTAESIMPVYLYLMGKEAANITGRALNVREFDAADLKGE